MLAPILIASDLTSRSDRVLERCRLMGHPLILVHVAPGDDPLSGAGLERLRALVSDDISGSPPDIEVIITSGSVSEVIARIAAQRACGLIATGIASFDSPKDYVLGTTVDFVVRRAACPVLVVKRKPRQPYRSVIVATDFSNCARQALESAARIFPETSIRLLNTFGPPFPAFLDPAEMTPWVREERTKDMDALLSDLASDLRARIEPEIVASPLELVLEDHRAGGRCDLLVLGTHGRSGLVHAAIGSRAADLLNHALCDVLMVRGS